MAIKLLDKKKMVGNFSDEILVVLETCNVQTEQHQQQGATSDFKQEIGRNVY